MLRPGVVLCAVVAAACGGAASRPTSLTGADILRVVPADTPYVYAALEPLPAAYVDQAMRDGRPELERRAKDLDAVARDSRAGALARTLVRELLSHDSPAGLAEIGVATGRGAWVVYGIGLAPALRVELSAPDRMAAFLDGVVAKSGVSVATEMSGNHRYRVLRDAASGLALAWAIDGGALVATVASSAKLAEVLPQLFADRLPARSLADTDAVRALARAYGFKSLQVLAIDLPRLVGALADAIPADAACRGELAAIAGEAPRIVAGFEELSPAHDRVRVTVELSLRLCKLLAGLRAPAAGVGLPLGSALARIGLAGDVKAAADVARLWAAAVRANPYRCPFLSGLNRDAGDLWGELAAPLPEWLAPLRGASAVIYDADFTNVRGYVLVTAADPLQVVGTLIAMIPSLRGASLPPDGTPVPLPASLGPIDHVAVKGNVVGVSAGGSEGDLGRAIAAPVPPDPPLFHLAVDGARVGATLGAFDDSLRGLSGKWDVAVSVDDRGVTLRVDRRR